MSNEIIQLDVGGTPYKVPRSVLESDPKTMLASLVSERWKQEDHDKDNKPIFIDRDGERFRYVLDYLRDGKILLSVSVSKASILKELEYFGFENVDSANICIDRFPAAKAIMANLPACEKYYELQMQDMNKKIGALQNELAFHRLAYECFKLYCRSSENESSVEVKVTGKTVSSSQEEMEILFQKCLTPYRLQFLHGDLKSYFDGRFGKRPNETVKIALTLLENDDNTLNDEPKAKRARVKE